MPRNLLTNPNGAFADQAIKVQSRFDGRFKGYCAADHLDQVESDAAY
jgi:hypothetical protein